MQAPNGDRAGVSRCSEGDNAGHIREVPQEEYSPSMYIAQSRANHKEESQLIGSYIANTAKNINIQDVAMVTVQVYAQTCL
jgi:hypothetical protein